MIVNFNREFSPAVKIGVGTAEFLGGFALSGAGMWNAVSRYGDLVNSGERYWNFDGLGGTARSLWDVIWTQPIQTADTMFNFINNTITNTDASVIGASISAIGAVWGARILNEGIHDFKDGAKGNDNNLRH